MADATGDATMDEAKLSRLRKVQEKNKRAQARYRQKQKEKMQNFEGQCSKQAEELAALRAANARLEAERNSMAEEERFPSVAERFWSQTLREVISRRLGEDQAQRVDASPLGHGGMGAVYKGLMEELQARLARFDREGGVESQKAISDFIHALRAMRHLYAEGQSTAERVQGGAGLVAENSAAHGVPPLGHWKAALAAARVAPEQRARILGLRGAHLARMEDISRARKDIVWELQQATVTPDTVSLRQAAFTKAVQRANQLQESLVAEFLAKEEFKDAVCHHVLTELQEARMLVAAFPHFLDVGAVCDVLAAEEAAAASSESDGTVDAAGQPSPPGSLQRPGTALDDTKPDLLAAALAWSCAGQQQVGAAQQPAFGGGAQSGFSQSPPAFSGGGHGSSFAPLPRGRAGP